jgi:hypothetical protein
MPTRIRLRAAIVVPVVIVAVVCAVVAAGLAGVGGRKEPAAIPAQCPSYADREAPFAPLLSAARTHYVPFTPTGALLCFYANTADGTAPPNETLAKEVHITAPAGASGLADDLDAAARSSANLNRGISAGSCGAELFESLDAYFQGDGRSILVRISGLPGCSFATNGPKHARIGNSEIVPELQRLLGISDWMTPTH